MKVFIPTYGRAGAQPTFHALTAAGIPLSLVVQEREALKYTQYAKYPNCQVIVLPDTIRTIAPTRQFILDECVTHRDSFCMVDDDLEFFHRRTDDPTKLRTISSKELHAAFQEMEERIEDGMCAHAGFAAREGANRHVNHYVDNTRIMRVLGYAAEPLIYHNIRFDAMEVMEDFHVALSLLERRYSNCVLNTYAHNQAGSGKSGGCSHFRTPELHAENARRLAALHPGVVKVVEKTTKTAWGGGTRTDVIIQWKKAYEQTRNRPSLLD